jgi:hypothetical protein
MSNQYKFGDVIVRCYPNNFNAICIYLDDIKCSLNNQFFLSSFKQ